MKKNLLKLVFMLGLIVTAVGCSNDETSFTPEQAKETDNKTLTARGTFWDGQIGVVDANGFASFTVPVASVKADLEQMLLDQGIQASLNYVSIGMYINEQDSSDSTYAIIGGTKGGLSTGVMLNKTAQGGLFYLDPGTGGSVGGYPKTNVTCRGCGTGCNLRYVKLDGQKVFYCNENGCGDWCEKIITD